MRLFLSQLLYLRCGFRVLAGEELYHSVREVDLIVEPPVLQMIDVQVEFGLQLDVGHFVHQFAGEHRAVEAAYDLEIDGLSIVWKECKVHAVVLSHLLVDVQQMHDDAVQDSALAYAVDAAQDVDAGLQVPADMLVSVPERFYLDALDVLSVHLSFTV